MEAPRQKASLAPFVKPTLGQYLSLLSVTLQLVAGALCLECLVPV